MTPTVTLIDYGSGNLLSVTRALEHCGAQVVLARSAPEVERAERLVLPGVGAFADGMNGLRERELVEPIRRYGVSGRPLLGICLGMQMLATQSSEFGTHAGLGLIPGKVRPVPATSIDGLPQKIPHIGWARVHPAGADGWQGTAFEGLPPDISMYLVHSFHLLPDDPRHVLGVCQYGGHRITAAVQCGNIIGCQFHPEKSAAAGLALLSRFIQL